MSLRNLLRLFSRRYMLPVRCMFRLAASHIPKFVAQTPKEGRTEPILSSCLPRVRAADLSSQHTHSCHCGHPVPLPPDPSASPPAQHTGHQGKVTRTPSAAGAPNPPKGERVNMRLALLRPGGWRPLRVLSNCERSAAAARQPQASAAPWCGVAGVGEDRGGGGKPRHLGEKEETWCTRVWDSQSPHGCAGQAMMRVPGRALAGSLGSSDSRLLRAAAGERTSMSSERHKQLWNSRRGTGELRAVCIGFNVSRVPSPPRGRPSGAGPPHTQHTYTPLATHLGGTDRPKAIE